MLVPHIRNVLLGLWVLRRVSAPSAANPSEPDSPAMRLTANQTRLHDTSQLPGVRTFRRCLQSTSSAARTLVQKRTACVHKEAVAQSRTLYRRAGRQNEECNSRHTHDHHFDGDLTDRLRRSDARPQPNAVATNAHLLSIADTYPDTSYPNTDGHGTQLHRSCLGSLTLVSRALGH
jgi:hypothetical protein